MNTYPNKNEAAINIVRGMPAEVFVEFLNIPAMHNLICLPATWRMRNIVNELARDPSCHLAMLKQCFDGAASKTTKLIRPWLPLHSALQANSKLFSHTSYTQKCLVGLIYLLDYFVT